MTVSGLCKEKVLSLGEDDEFCLKQGSCRCLEHNHGHKL